MVAYTQICRKSFFFPRNGCLDIGLFFLLFLDGDDFFSERLYLLIHFGSLCLLVKEEQKLVQLVIYLMSSYIRSNNCRWLMTRGAIKRATRGMRWCWSKVGNKNSLYVKITRHATNSRFAKKTPCNDIGACGTHCASCACAQTLYFYWHTHALVRSDWKQGWPRAWVHLQYLCLLSSYLVSLNKKWLLSIVSGPQYHYLTLGLVVRLILVSLLP